MRGKRFGSKKVLDVLSEYSKGIDEWDYKNTMTFLKYRYENTIILMETVLRNLKFYFFIIL